MNNSLRRESKSTTRRKVRVSVASSPLVNAESFRGFADLERHYERGRDFKTLVQGRPASQVAVVVPHGGRIEEGTSEIGRAIAGTDFNFYAFEGIRESRNYEALHLTSHRFDDPDCLALLATCSIVVAIHGRKIKSDGVLLGGLDLHLKSHLLTALNEAGISAEQDLHFPARHPGNVCNRGTSGKGVQLEISGSLRHSPFRTTLIEVVRSALKVRDADANRGA